jgi:hypothetical protein
VVVGADVVVVVELVVVGADVVVVVELVVVGADVVVVVELVVVGADVVVVTGDPVACAKACCWPTVIVCTSGARKAIDDPRAIISKAVRREGAVSPSTRRISTRPARSS